MSRIEFSSTKFLPYLPESCQVNPGVYGFELASWLSLALAKACSAAVSLRSRIPQTQS